MCMHCSPPNCALSLVLLQQRSVKRKEAERWIETKEERALLRRQVAQRLKESGLEVPDVLARELAAAEQQDRQQ